MQLATVSSTTRTPSLHIAAALIGSGPASRTQPGCPEASLLSCTDQALVRNSIRSSCQPCASHMRARVHMHQSSRGGYARACGQRRRCAPESRAGASCQGSHLHAVRMPRKHSPLRSGHEDNLSRILICRSGTVCPVTFLGNARHAAALPRVCFQCRRRRGRRRKGAAGSRTTWFSARQAAHAQRLLRVVRLAAREQRQRCGGVQRAAH